MRIQPIFISLGKTLADSNKKRMPDARGLGRRAGSVGESYAQSNENVNCVG